MRINISPVLEIILTCQIWMAITPSLQASLRKINANKRRLASGADHQELKTPPIARPAALLRVQAVGAVLRGAGAEVLHKFSDGQGGRN